MHKVHLQSSDLENIRFTYSPLVQLVTSYHALYQNLPAATLDVWVEDARHALHGMELVYLNALIAQCSYIADFITPTPPTAENNIEEGLALIAATSTEIIRDNVLRVIDYDGENEIRRHYLAQPREAIDCLLQELRLYWQHTLARHWPRMQTVLENDVLYHARQMALHGIDSMFSDLSEKISYENGVVLLKKHEKRNQKKEWFLEGQGLYLVPMAIYPEGMLYQIAPHWHPMIMYGARGAGLWFQSHLPEPDKALRVALGTGRARVLVALQSPAHTGELALRLNLTSGAISQHLRRLHQAGLVESHRSSHRVYYRLSQRGEKLVGLFVS